MKFKVILDRKGTFQVQDRDENFEIICPFCENKDIYHVHEDMDLYCGDCGRLLIIKGKGKTCFETTDITKLKNIIRRGTSKEDRRNAVILLGRALEWCEDLSLCEFLLQLSLKDPDNWIREKSERILNLQRECGSAKLKLEINKLRQSPFLSQPPILKKALLSQESFLFPAKNESLSDKPKEIIAGEEGEIEEEVFSDTDEIEEDIVVKSKNKTVGLVDILLETIDEEDIIQKNLFRVEKESTSEETIGAPPDDTENLMELLEDAMSSIASTKEVIEKPVYNEPHKYKTLEKQTEFDQAQSFSPEEMKETEEEVETETENLSHPPEEIEEMEEEVETETENLSHTPEEIEEMEEEVEPETENLSHPPEEIEEMEEEVEPETENLSHTPEEIEETEEEVEPETENLSHPPEEMKEPEIVKPVKEDKVIDLFPEETGEETETEEKEPEPDTLSHPPEEIKHLKPVEEVEDTQKEHHSSPPPAHKKIRFLDEPVAEEAEESIMEKLFEEVTVESLIEQFVVEESPQAKYDIIFVLGEMKDCDATEFLVELMLSDPDNELRMAALEALQNIGDKKCLPDLLKCMKDEKDAEIRKKVAQLYSLLKYIVK